VETRVLDRKTYIRDANIYIYIFLYIYIYIYIRHVIPSHALAYVSCVSIP